MTVEWDSERLAGLIEKRRPLYDFHLKEHSNKHLLDQLWAEVATEMNSAVIDCKSKWTSMRNSYARYLRDMKNAAYGGTKKRKWYLADCMTFLSDFMGQHKRPGHCSEASMDDNSAGSYEQDDQESMQSFSNETFHFNRICDDRLSRVSSTNLHFSNRSEPSIRSADKCANADLLFFRSLMVDINKLSERRKRKFKEIVMASLHSLLDSQEDEEQKCH